MCFQDAEAAANRLPAWVLESLLAWSLMFVVPIGLAAGLSVLIPYRHVAAKLGGVKWALYSSLAMYPVLILWYTWYASFPLMVRVPGGMTIYISAPAPEPPIWLAGAALGMWWALGASANPYERRRGWRRALVIGGLYLSCWACITQLLFPLGHLSELL